MENKYLQPLLQAGLLDIGDNDERLANIEKSITDLEKNFKKDLSLLPSYTLVGLDPNINANDPVLEETETIVATHWKALRAKFSERPIPILRAVILHALYNAGVENAKIARIIYLTSSNFYPYAKLGREKTIVEGILTELAELAEENAAEEWSLEKEEPKLKISTLKVVGLKASQINVNKAQLEKKLSDATKQSTNGYHVQYNLEQWAESFSKQASEGIANAIETTVSKVSESLDLTSIETSINQFFTAFKKSLDQSLKDSFTSIQAVERRSKLLWWKETLYSASLKDSYRSIDKVLQPIVMSEDLYQQLPDVTPVSVDYLLKDTLLLLNATADKKITFAKFLEEISKESNKSVLKNYFKDKEKQEKRVSITNFIGLLIHDKAEGASLKECTGIDGNENISYSDIAVMLLHDWMAEYLITKG